VPNTHNSSEISFLLFDQHFENQRLSGVCEPSWLSPAGLLAWARSGQQPMGVCVPYAKRKTFLLYRELQEVTGAASHGSGQ
jgi:hypothetical protein